MAMKPPYARRDIATMQPEICGRYHDLVMANDLSGYEQLLDEYQPHITLEERTELIEEFKRLAETALRKRWHAPKSR